MPTEAVGGASPEPGGYATFCSSTRDSATRPLCASLTSRKSLFMTEGPGIRIHT